MARVPSLDADRAVDHIVRSMKLMKRFYSWYKWVTGYEAAVADRLRIQSTVYPGADQ